jgi:hypothetical protein
MKKIFCLVVLLMACALINACEPCIEVETKETTLPIDVLHEGQYGYLLQEGENLLNGNPRSRVFGSQDDYDNILATYTDEYSETLDFAEGRVLLVDLGLRNTGGYSIKVTSVVEHDHYVLANVSLSEPGENCIVTQAFTHPFQFVWVPSTKQILICETLEIINCNE